MHDLTAFRGIAIATESGVLKIMAELPIPHAEGGEWSQARLEKLIQTIQDTVDIAEIVDAEFKEDHRRPS